MSGAVLCRGCGRPVDDLGECRNAGCVVSPDYRAPARSTVEAGPVMVPLRRVRDDVRSLEERRGEEERAVLRRKARRAQREARRLNRKRGK